MFIISSFTVQHSAWQRRFGGCNAIRR